MTHSEQKAILRETACNPRDHVTYSPTLGTGLRLAEIVRLIVGDVYSPEGKLVRRKAASISRVKTRSGVSR
jgi:hypothetical protein